MATLRQIMQKVWVIILQVYAEQGRPGREVVSTVIWVQLPGPGSTVLCIMFLSLCLHVNWTLATLISQV